MNGKKIYRLVTAAVMLLVMCRGLTKAYAGTDASGYDAQNYYFEYYEYNDPVINVSPFSWKETTSYMSVTNLQSSGSYRVYALGAVDKNNVGDNYVDCSGGNYFEFTQNNQTGILENYVREWGYQAAGIKGIYMGDERFAATGVFAADTNEFR